MIGKNPLGFMLLVCLFGASHASAQTAPAPATQQSTAQQAQRQTGPVDRNGAVMLMRNALIALDQANKTNEYSVLRATASEAFQVNSTGKLSEIFAGQRREGLNLAYVAIMEPRWTVEPQVEPSGLIHMAGYFEVTPVPVAFDLLFTQQKGQWLLFGVTVSLVQQPPAGPAKVSETKPEAKPAPRPATPSKPAATAPARQR